MLFQNNLLIIKGEDHLLIDCGTVCSRAFSQYHLPIFNIKNFLITHSHADHIGGLEEVALMGRYFVKKKPKMIISEEYQDILWNRSLKGGCGYNERNINGRLLNFTDFFEVIRPVKINGAPREMMEMDINSIHIKLFRTMHIPDSAKTWEDSFITYGIIIDNRLLYTSDTRFDPALFDDIIKTVPEIEYIMHDCQLFTGGVHASYQELLNLDVKIRNKMILMHYGDNYLDFHAEEDGFLGFARQGHYYHFK
jgi:hydroxyacylglutathione hydrolase